MSLKNIFKSEARTKAESICERLKLALAEDGDVSTKMKVLLDESDDKVMSKLEAVTGFVTESPLFQKSAEAAFRDVYNLLQLMKKNEAQIPHRYGPGKYNYYYVPDVLGAKAMGYDYQHCTQVLKSGIDVIGDAYANGELPKTAENALVIKRFASLFDVHIGDVLGAEQKQYVQRTHDMALLAAQTYGTLGLAEEAADSMKLVERALTRGAVAKTESGAGAKAKAVFSA